MVGCHGDESTSHPNWNSTGITVTVIWVSLVSDFHISGCHTPVLASQKATEGFISILRPSWTSLRHTPQTVINVLFWAIYFIFSWPEVHQYASLDSRFYVFYSRFCLAVWSQLEHRKPVLETCYPYTVQALKCLHQPPMNRKKGRLRCCAKLFNVHVGHILKCM